jgi:WD40 repeat protein
LARPEQPARLNGRSIVAFSPDGGRMVTGSSEGEEAWADTLDLREAVTGQRLTTLRPDPGRRGPGGLHTVAYSRDGSVIATASADSADVFDADIGARLCTVRQADIVGMDISPDGSHLAVSFGDTVMIRAVEADEKPAVLGAHSGLVGAVAYSPCGRWLLSCDREQLIVRDVATFSPVAERSLDHGLAGRLVFSADGTRFASLHADRVVQVWSAQSWEPVLMFRGGDPGSRVGRVNMVFSPDGRRIAISLGADSTVRMYDAHTGEETFVLSWPSAQWVAFSPDGTRLAAGVSRGDVCIWDTAPNVRFEERAETTAAWMTAKPIVERLMDKAGDWASLTARIEADTSLEGPVRRAALDMALRLRE